MDTAAAPRAVPSSAEQPSSSKQLLDELLAEPAERFERRISELPGVVAVGSASTLPLGEDLDYFQEVRFVDREVALEVDPREQGLPTVKGAL